MTKKIFKSNILVAVVVLIFGIACVMAILYQHFGKQINTELEKEASYLAYGVEQNGVDYLNQIKEKDDRITYIAEDGTVLYDNQADAVQNVIQKHCHRRRYTMHCAFQTIQCSVFPVRSFRYGCFLWRWCHR